MDLLCTEQIILNDCDGLTNNNSSITSNNSNNNSDKNKNDNNKNQVEFSNVESSSSNISYLNEFNYVNTALVDPTFLTERCLENLLKTEEKYFTNSSYFENVQRDITPPMRKIVAEWMIEVCEERKCQEEVVLLALNYLDRFLSKTPVRKTHLQILAAACLLLASKLREPMCRCLSADMLVIYTDNSIYKHDLINWELHVLSRLNWDLSSVTALDFLEILLVRLPIQSKELPQLAREKIRQHAQAFISLAAKELYFTTYTASTLAASSIAAALNGPNVHLTNKIELKHLLNLLTDLTGVEQDYLRDCMFKLECTYEEYTRTIQPYLIALKTQNSIDMKPSKYNDENNALIPVLHTTNNCVEKSEKKTKTQKSTKAQKTKIQQINSNPIQSDIEVKF